MSKLQPAGDIVREIVDEARFDTSAVVHNDRFQVISGHAAIIIGMSALPLIADIRGYNLSVRLCQ